jgi:hypothetical protein
MGQIQVPRMTNGEYEQLLAGLKAGNKAAVVSVNEPLPEGVSHDDAMLTMASGDRYVTWGNRRVPHFQNGVLHQGDFSMCHILDKGRAIQLIAAGALWMGDDSDHPAL